MPKSKSIKLNNKKLINKNKISDNYLNNINYELTYSNYSHYKQSEDDFNSGDEMYDEMDQCNSSGLKPVQRNTANARERARMRILSKAFYKLKTTLPWVPKDTKLSKLDTLRLATSYILHLKLLLNQEQNEKSPQILNMSWPFSFQAQDLLVEQNACKTMDIG